MRRLALWSAAAILCVAVAACGSDDSSGGSGSETTAGDVFTGLKVDTATCTAPTDAKVKLQLQWVTQAQFAGYYVAHGTLMIVLAAR